MFSNESTMFEIFKESAIWRVLWRQRAISMGTQMHTSQHTYFFKYFCLVGLWKLP